MFVLLESQISAFTIGCGALSFIRQPLRATTKPRQPSSTVTFPVSVTWVIIGDNVPIKS